MTDAQKNKITELRAQGCGYKKIAQILGISDSTVKSYCKRNAIVKKAEVKVNEGCCEQCGREIVQNIKTKKRRFCCDKCRMDWWNSHLDSVKRKAFYTLVCQNCGKEFTVYGKAARKYCCHECYVEDRFGGGRK